MLNAKLTAHSGTNREESEELTFDNHNELHKFVKRNGFAYVDTDGGFDFYESADNERLRVGV